MTPDPQPPAAAPDDRAPASTLDRLDRQILACLREDGRMGNSEIARRVHVGEKTVRRRIQRMADEHGMRIVPVIDPDRVGLDTCVWVGLKVRLSRIEEVAAEVRRMPEVRYLAFTTGPWDLLVEAFVGSRDHMAEFVISSIGGVEGVVGAESFNVMRIAKFGYEWEVPERLSPAARAPLVAPGEG